MTPRTSPTSVIRNALSAPSTDELKEELRTAQTPNIRRRRGIIGLSFAGMAALGAVSLLQTGVLGHLPDPPADAFDSDQVNLADDAYDAGVPDGPLAVRTLATNVPLAALGGEERASQRPWIPLAFTGKAAAGAWASGKSIWKMARGEQPWCAYRVAGAAANLGIVALALPEAWRAVRSAWDWLTGD
jgi:hypothetical protein